MKNKTQSVFFFAVLTALVAVGCSTPNAETRRGPVDQSVFADIDSRLNNRTNWMDGPSRWIDGPAREF
jgi:hypothetical protein